MRSATAPEIRAGVIAAKVPRKATNAISGTPTFSNGLIPRRPKALRSPMNAPLLRKARVYPTITQSRGTTRMHHRLIIIMLRVLLVRVRPP